MLGDVFDSTIRNPTEARAIWTRRRAGARVSVFLLGSLASTENGLACVIIKRNTAATQTGFKCWIESLHRAYRTYLHEY